MMSKSTRVIATGVIALCAALSPALADQWKAPGKTRTTHRVERGALVTEVDATSPGIAVVQSAGVASMAGDDATQNIANALPSDPSGQLTLRRAIVAHEAGHSMNFFHHNVPGYLMYGGALQSTGAIPTAFGTVPSATVNCNICNPAQQITFTDWDETSTIRIRP